MPGPKPIPPENRVMRYVRKTSGCWHWTGLVDGRGYGFVRGSRDANGFRRHFVAHRLIYEMFVGPVPEGHDLHHQCKNVSCVNPKHLSPVPHGEHQRSHGADVCRVCGSSDWRTTRLYDRAQPRTSRRCAECYRRYMRNR